MPAVFDTEYNFSSLVIPDNVLITKTLYLKLLVLQPENNMQNFTIKHSGG